MRTANRYSSILCGIAVTVCFQSALLLFFTSKPAMPNKNLLVTELFVYSKASEPSKQTAKIQPKTAPAQPPKTPKPVTKSKPKKAVKPVKQSVNKQNQPSPPVPREVSDQQSTEPVEPVAINNKPLPVPLYKIDAMPRMIGQLAPKYPEKMRRLGRTGKLKLALLIDAQGRVIDVDVLSSAGDEFDRAAIDAVMKSHYAPALIGQRPVPVRIILPISFSLF
jgi:TonB family protein